MKFKVGDIIRGTREADGQYAYTTSKSKCRVVEVYKYGDIEVEIIDHETLKGQIGEVYGVEEQYFKSERNTMDIVSPTKTPSWLL